MLPRNNLAFFLLRLYKQYFINFESYETFWKAKHQDKPIDQTPETFNVNQGKWFIGNGPKVTTNVYVIPYVPELI